FLFFPVAPPRLAHIGLVDSVTVRSHAYRALQPPSLTNEYAAFPSLHVGWDLLVGITLVRAASHRLLRGVGALLAVPKALAVIATANHYVIDVAGGGLIALTSLLVVEHARRRRSPAPLQPARRGCRWGGHAPHLADPAADRDGCRSVGGRRRV